MTNLAAIVAASLLTHGVPADIAETVRFEISEADQGVLTVGYDRDERRNVTAQMLVPTALDAVAILTDRERIAGLLAQGLRAFPAGFRPTIPSWIADSAEAKRSDAMRARARTLASAVVTDDEDLPWAA